MKTLIALTTDTGKRVIVNKEKITHVVDGSRVRQVYVGTTEPIRVQTSIEDIEYILTAVSRNG